MDALAKGPRVLHSLPACMYQPWSRSNPARWLSGWAGMLGPLGFQCVLQGMTVDLSRTTEVQRLASGWALHLAFRS